jgi:hypothetical protein
VKTRTLGYFSIVLFIFHFSLGWLPVTQEFLVSTTRVLLALGREPALMCDVLRSCLEQHPDVLIVGEVSDPVDLLVAVGETEPDLVLHNWTDPSRLPSIFTHLFDQYPAVRVLGLTADHEQALLVERPIVASPIPAALDSLLSVIRRSSSLLV